jgi:hypothetical protein
LGLTGKSAGVRQKAIFAALVCFSFLPLLSTSAQPAQNQSSLTVSFVLRKGRLAVNRDHASFVFSDTFKSRIAQSPAQTEKELTQAKRLILDDLDRVFLQTSQIYWYSLPDDEKAHDRDGELNDELSNRIRTFSANDWTITKTTFATWAAANSQRDGLGVAFSQLFGDTTFNNNLDDTALIFFSTDDDTGLPNYDADAGTARFQIGDPVSGWDSQDFHVCFPLSLTDNCSAGEDQTGESTRVRHELKGLSTRLWSPRIIRGNIGEYYAGKGFLPTVNLGGARENSKWINIQISPRIGRILLPTGIDYATTAKILYLLLPDGDFRFFIKSKTSLIQTQQISIPSTDPNKPPQLINLAYVDFLTLGAGRKIGDEPLLNQFKLQAQQAQLSQLGFVLGQRVSGGNPERAGKSYLDFDVAKLAPADSASAEKAPTSPGAAGPSVDQGFVDHREQEPELQTPPVPKTAKVKQQSQQTIQPPPRELRNYLGGGFDYRPGQGVRPFVIYQRQKLGPGNLALQVGDQQQALGSITYFADFAFFGERIVGGRLFRRLSLQFTGSSDFEAKRIFNAVDTDERRTGGKVRAELELFRDLHDQLLRIFVEGQHATVDLSRDGKSVAKANLNTIDVGAYYLLQADESHYPRLVRLEPRLRFGLGLANTEPNYVAFTCSGNFHKKLPRLLEADITGRLEQDSTRTPLFEQASFGGPDVNRGFRRDDAIGRSLWSLQNELWLPIPGTGGASAGPQMFLRRNVRLAPFADLSGIYQTTGAPAGFRAAPGFGLRVIYNLVVMKIDWAYGIGDGASARGHGRFSFGVSFNRSL